MDDGDAAMVARVRGGDTDAYRTLVERYSANLFHLAYRMMGNEQDAEDVVQESFLRAFRQLKQFESRANFGTWIHRIAVNCSLDLLRKRQRQAGRTESLSAQPDDEIHALPSEGPSPERLLVNAETREQVNLALNQLTALERAAFVLRHFEEKSIAEISASLGVSGNAAKQSIFRAVAKLRVVLEPMVNSTP